MVHRWRLTIFVTVCSSVVSACVALDEEALLFAPLNGIEPEWARGATRQIHSTSDIEIDVDSGLVDGIPFGTDFRTIGPYACAGEDRTLGVFVVQSIDIPPGVTIRIRGARAVGFLVGDDVSIRGVLDVSGGVGACIDPPRFSACPGPGGWTGGATGNPPEAGHGPEGGGPGFARGGDGNETGGGGGGHGSRGGDGGNEVPGTLLGGEGGALYDGTAPLCGGSGGGGGGRGAGTGDEGQHGGGGGGAVHIVSLAEIFVGGEGSGINAGGGGGSGDHIRNFDDGGGGGGAGGSVVLEAPSIVIGSGAVIAANGGGGGGGYRGGDEYEDGAAGGLSSAPTPAGDGGGRGGSALAPVGETAPDARDGTGGGGGGVGRIRLRTSDPAGPTLLGVTSPAATIEVVDF